MGIEQESVIFLVAYWRRSGLSGNGIELPGRTVDYCHEKYIRIKISYETEDQCYDVCMTLLISSCEQAKKLWILYAVTTIL